MQDLRSEGEGEKRRNRWRKEGVKGGRDKKGRGNSGRRRRGRKRERKRGERKRQREKRKGEGWRGKERKNQTEEEGGEGEGGTFMTTTCQGMQLRHRQLLQKYTQNIQFVCQKHLV